MTDASQTATKTKFFAHEGVVQGRRAVPDWSETNPVMMSDLDLKAAEARHPKILKGKPIPKLADLYKDQGSVIANRPRTIGGDAINNRLAHGLKWQCSGGAHDYLQAC